MRDLEPVFCTVVVHLVRTLRNHSANPENILAKTTCLIRPSGHQTNASAPKDLLRTPAPCQGRLSSQNIQRPPNLASRPWLLNDNVTLRSVVSIPAASRCNVAGRPTTERNPSFNPLNSHGGDNSTWQIWVVMISDLDTRFVVGCVHVEPGDRM